MSPRPQKQKKNERPPSPWASSSTKREIIDALKDETSDIHLLIGEFTSTDFANVNFGKIMEKFSCSQYKKSNFRGNMKRLLIHFLNKTGPFKPEKAEPWYTSASNVSRAYALLFKLYMDKNQCAAINAMSVD